MPRNGSGTYSPPVNSWNPATNGVPATASDWQAQLNDIRDALTQSVARDGQTIISGDLQMGGNKLTNLEQGSLPGDSLRWEQLFSQGQQADIASAATVDIGAKNTTNLNITGTTTITSFGANYNGPRFLRFAGVLTLTHGASLVLPGAANITTAAGDCAIVVPNGNPATGWRMAGYQSASGVSVLTTGNQTIDGIKTFVLSPSIPSATSASHPVTKTQLDEKAPIASPAFTGLPTSTTASAGDNSTRIATTAFVAASTIGVAQSWQGLTASRAMSTTYTNSTGKPISVFVSASVGNGSGALPYIQATVSGVLVDKSVIGDYNGSNYAGISASVSFIVPNGADYFVATTVGGATLLSWSELR